jgi:hypothetical protein
VEIWILEDGCFNNSKNGERMLINGSRIGAVRGARLLLLADGCGPCCCCWTSGINHKERERKEKRKAESTRSCSWLRQPLLAAKAP